MWRISGGRAVKVLNRASRNQEAKLRAMVQLRVRHEALCWPEQVTRLKDGRLAFAMPLAEGAELQSLVMMPGRLRKSKWTRLELVKVCLGYLDAVAQLHGRGILVGDVNARNVMVNDQAQVRLIDLDSCQFDRFRAPMGTVPYLHPDLLGRRLADVPRTVEHELFAVATLVFMVVMPGKPPYSHQGGGDPAKNIREGNFPYPLGQDRRSRGVPVGPWSSIWSHLPRRLKEMFVEAFAHHRVAPLQDWYEALLKYQTDLRQCRLDDSLFPERRRKREGCRVIEVRTCVESRCSEQFDIDEDEAARLRELNFDLPRRCPRCRQRRRVLRHLR